MSGHMLPKTRSAAYLRLRRGWGFCGQACPAVLLSLRPYQEFTGLGQLLALKLSVSATEQAGGFVSDGTGEHPQWGAWPPERIKQDPEGFLRANMNADDYAAAVAKRRQEAQSTASSERIAAHS